MRPTATKQDIMSNLLAGMLGGACGGLIFAALAILIGNGWPPSPANIFLMVAMFPVLLLGAIIGGIIGSFAGILLSVGYRWAHVTVTARVAIYTGISVGLIYPLTLVLVTLLVARENSAEIGDAIAAIPAGIISGVGGGWTAWKVKNRLTSVQT